MVGSEVFDEIPVYDRYFSRQLLCKNLFTAFRKPGLMFFLNVKISFFFGLFF